MDILLVRHGESEANAEGRLQGRLDYPLSERGRAQARQLARWLVQSQVGWDVAFTTQGPAVVEANGDWDPDVTQLAPDRGLLGTALGPYLARRDAVRMIGLGLGRWRQVVGPRMDRLDGASGAGS